MSRDDVDTIVAAIREYGDGTPESLARDLARRLDTLEGDPGDAIERLAGLPEGRRWLRASVLPILNERAAARLASRLLSWSDDFRPDRRDRTTLDVARRLSRDDLLASTQLLAGSNAASVFWQRLAELGNDALIDAALRVMSRAGTLARETMLHTLLLDPFGPLRLPAEAEYRLLVAALADSDPEIRGLAAELAMEIAPELLLETPERHPLDESERLRAAYWTVALAHRPEDATEQAIELVTDETATLDARRSALAAIGEQLRTRQAAPVLSAMVAHPDPVLAGDAADLMWRLHRNPAVAQAAARSPHQPVRELAERLLHPERGSPAAGGSRPGDPTRTADIYQEMLERMQASPNSDDESDKP
jgi:hypothetical protein